MRLGALVASAMVLTAVPSARAVPADPPVIAVLYFDYEGQDAELGPLRKGLASMLISDLAGLDTIRVVERDRLESVLDELKLQATAKIDPSSAVRAGKLLGARFLVLGRYFDAMAKLRIDSRVIEVETGRVVLSTGATGSPDEFLVLEQKLAGTLETHFKKVVPPVVRPRPRASPPARTVMPPARLSARTAVKYGRALDAIDTGDRAAAMESLKRVIAEAPDFALASADLDRLMK